MRGWVFSRAEQKFLIIWLWGPVGKGRMNKTVAGGWRRLKLGRGERREDLPPLK